METPQTNKDISPMPRTGKPAVFFLLFLCLLLIPFSAPADPGFLFLTPGPEMRRSGGGDSQGGGHGSGMGLERKKGEEGKTGAEGKGHPGAGGPPAKAETHREGAGKKEDGKKDTDKKEKRAAMSHPAHFSLLLGTPPEIRETALPELLSAEAAILRPDLSGQTLQPREEGSAIRIRDAALIQGTYHLKASLKTEDGEARRYRLFTQASMRNTGEKADPPAETGKDRPKNPLPWFSIEDLSPDPGGNFAKIHRKYTGDTLPLKIRLGDTPLPGLPVTLTTGGGWRQTRTTDEAGEVTFTLIKESFHDRGVQKQPIAFYVTAEIRSTHPLFQKETGEEYPPEGGSCGPSSPEKEEILRTGLALSVHPTPLDWESRATGFYALVLVTLTVALGTALRRRRRKAGAWI
jgi:hypothetical protein